MGAQIGTSDVTSMLGKSSMVGQTQQLRVDQRAKETDRARDAETGEEGDSSLLSTDRADGVGRSRTIGTPDERALQRLGRGNVDWQQGGGVEGQAKQSLPASLTPQSRGAGSASSFNIPFWLQTRQPETQTDNPRVAHTRLMKGLREMVGTELKQYVRSNNPPYDKPTLREFYDVLSDGKTAPFGPSTARGDAAGLNNLNWNRAQNVVSIFDERPPAGEALDLVA